MSEKLDTLLSAMNESIAGRAFDDIPLKDPFWDARNAYMQALHQADGVHVPVSLVEENKIQQETKPTKAELDADTLEQLKSIGVH